MTQCGTPYPGERRGEVSPLICIRPPNHDGPHVTCLGYHPPPFDEYEFEEWPA